MTSHLRMLTTLILAAAGCSTQAQMFRDPSLDTLYAAQKYPELERAVAQRIAAQADDSQAVLALAIGALQSNDASRRTAAIGHAEACLLGQPQAAACHVALGSVLGVQAMSGGMLAINGSVGRIRGALSEALSLEPGWYAARSAMFEFYLQAPAVAGGSFSKAQELVRAAPKPDQVRALEARVALQESKYERALQLLSEVSAVGDSALTSDMRNTLAGAGAALIGEGQAEKARPAFERLLRERPDDAMWAYGLGRVNAEAGADAQALKLFEQSASLKGAEQLPIDYRACIAQQALGQKDAARASFARFIASGRGQAKSVDDGKKRLAQLGG